MGRLNPASQSLNKDDFNDTIIHNGVSKSLKPANRIDDPAGRKQLQKKGFRQIAKNEWQIKPNMLLRNDQDVEKILDESEIISVTDSQGVQRFQIHKLQENALLLDLGIKPGDMIKAVNGYEISGFSDIIETYFRIRKEALITLSLQRDRSSVNLVYHMKFDPAPKYKVEGMLQKPQVSKLFN